MMTTPGPIIYQNQPTAAIAPRFSWPFFIFRILSLFLVLIILFMIFQAVMLFISRSGSLNLRFGQLPIKVDRTPALTLSPTNTALQVGQSGKFAIDYFTGNKTIQGVDIVLKYDPNYLEFKPDNFFTPGSVFTQYPISQVNSSGLIRISAIATISQIGFNGSGQLGTIQFNTKKSGQTKLEIIYKPGDTTESNLVELQTGQEVLQIVKSATIDIKQ